MIAECFLVAALALPASYFTRPPIVSWSMAKSEEDRLRDWIRKHNEVEEIFIHPEPQEEVLHKNGWEKVPFTWRGNKIWIKRKPKSDQKHFERSA